MFFGFQSTQSNFVWISENYVVNRRYRWVRWWWISLSLDPVSSSFNKLLISTRFSVQYDPEECSFETLLDVFWSVMVRPRWIARWLIYPERSRLSVSPRVDLVLDSYSDNKPCCCFFVWSLLDFEIESGVVVVTVLLCAWVNFFFYKYRKAIMLALLRDRLVSIVGHTVLHVLASCRLV